MELKQQTLQSVTLMYTLVLIVPFMELKPTPPPHHRHTTTVLIVPFMELKRKSTKIVTIRTIVLIVPFMELKHLNKLHSH